MKEKSIQGDNNVAADTFSHTSNKKRENANAIFTSQKLEKSDELFNAVKNMTKKDSGYELNKATASDAQGTITSDPHTFTDTSNIILIKNY